MIPRPITGAPLGDHLEQEANNQLDRRGIKKDHRPEIGGGGEKSAGPKRQKPLREAKRYKSLLDTKT